MNGLTIIAAAPLADSPPRDLPDAPPPDSARGGRLAIGRLSLAGDLVAAWSEILGPPSLPQAEVDDIKAAMVDIDDPELDWYLAPSCVKISPLRGVHNIEADNHD